MNYKGVELKIVLNCRYFIVELKQMDVLNQVFMHSILKLMSIPSYECHWISAPTPICLLFCTNIMSYLFFGIFHISLESLDKGSQVLDLLAAGCHVGAVTSPGILQFLILNIMRKSNALMFLSHSATSFWLHFSYITSVVISVIHFLRLQAILSESSPWLHIEY